MRDFFSRFFGKPAPGAGTSAQGLVRSRVALVTGGAGLLGSAISRQLAREGARVAVHYFGSKAEAEALAGRLASEGGKSVAVQADIRDRPAVEEMVRFIEARLGPVDILINNAATVPTESTLKSFMDQSWNDYQMYIDTILRGTFHCCQAVLPGMKARGRGRIVNIGTTALNEVNAAVNPYVTAKGGLLGMTRSLAEEFGPYGITVNQVAPGWIWALERDPSGNEGKIFRDRSPVAPGVTRPQDVAAAVAFLASDGARMISGAYLPVCAGQVMP